MAAHEAVTWSSWASIALPSQTRLPRGAALPPLHRPRPEVLSCALLQTCSEPGEGKAAAGGGRGGPGLLRAIRARPESTSWSADRTGSPPMAGSVLRVRQHHRSSTQAILSTVTLQTQPPHITGGGIYNEQCLCETVCGEK